ncbi:unnamed protein product [Sphagnum tenellum]
MGRPVLQLERLPEEITTPYLRSLPEPPSPPRSPIATSTAPETRRSPKPSAGSPVRYPDRPALPMDLDQVRPLSGPAHACKS